MVPAYGHAGGLDFLAEQCFDLAAFVGIVRMGSLLKQPERDIDELDIGEALDLEVKRKAQRLNRRSPAIALGEWQGGQARGGLQVDQRDVVHRVVPWVSVLSAMIRVLGSIIEAFTLKTPLSPGSPCLGCPAPPRAGPTHGAAAEPPADPTYQRCSPT